MQEAFIKLTIAKFLIANLLYCHLQSPYSARVNSVSLSLLSKLSLPVFFRGYRTRPFFPPAPLSVLGDYTNLANRTSAGRDDDSHSRFWEC